MTCGEKAEKGRGALFGRAVEALVSRATVSGPDTTYAEGIVELESQLGEILLTDGLVTRAQFEEARQRAAETSRPLGEILVKAGVVTPHQLARVRARQEALEPLGPHEAKTVLVVEDEIEVVMALRDILSRAGFRVNTAMNGAEALAQCLTGKPFFPDLILLDLGLPVYRGAHLLCLLREQERTRDIPVVVLTGRGDPQEEAEVRGLGISAYLLKPAPAARLVEAIQGALLSNHERRSVLGG